MKFIIEVAIAMFAGYCCCYFISMETIGMKPIEVIEEYLNIILDKIEQE